MTIDEVTKMLTAKVECMKRESSGEDIDCNYRNCDECELCYAQGTTGEQIEALKVAVDAMKKQIPKPPKSIKEDYNEYMDLYCPTCGHDVGMYYAETGYSYMDNESNPRMCAKCGQLLFAKLEGE